MALSIDLAVLLANGVFTTLCSLIILYFIFTKRLLADLFYYSWAIGFLLYASEIFLRAYGAPIVYADVLGFVAFIFFTFGIVYLSRAKVLLYELAVFSIFSVIFVFLFSSGIVSYVYLADFGYTLVYLFVGIAIVHHRLIFGAAAERLAVGWFLLFLTNVLLIGMGWIENLFGIFAKVIILLGLMEYDFIVVSRRAHEKRFPPPEAGYGREGGLKLIVLPDNSNANLREMNWLRKKVEENVKEGEEIAIFVFQDVVPYKELRAVKWISPDKVSVYLFSSSAQKAKSEFTVLPMGLAQIGAALSQATKQCASSGKNCSVVFFHLSLLIHLYGAEAVQVMLLNKMGYLRENGVALYAVFYPSMHSDHSIVSLFTNLADEVIKL